MTQQPPDPSIQFGTATVHLAWFYVEYADGSTKRFTATEGKLVLYFTEHACVSPKGFLLIDALLRIIYGDEEPEDGKHALQEHISNIRTKIGDRSCLKCFPRMGYQLVLPSGCCTATVQEVRALIENLRKY